MRRESRRMGDVFLAENEAERSANASVPGPAPAPSPRRRRRPGSGRCSRISRATPTTTRGALEEARARRRAAHEGPAGWHAFCFGDTEPYAEEEDDDDEDEDEDEPRRAAAAGAGAGAARRGGDARGTAPTTRLVLQFDGVMTQRLVVMQCGWLAAR
ncbi:hypothetical protein JL720_15668 [Aureococcus anophagefferens]|nr:hypothetical protein JL720_15668 [Aureococcus anophagefferens]